MTRTYFQESLALVWLLAALDTTHGKIHEDCNIPSILVVELICAVFAAYGNTWLPCQVSPSCRAGRGCPILAQSGYLPGACMLMPRA